MGLIIFDFDGTLARMDIDYDGARQALRDYFLARGIDMAFRPLQRKAAEAAALAGGRAAEDAARILDRFELERLGNSRLAPGAARALERLRAAGHRLAVLSNTGERCIRGVLGREGLDGMFDLIAGRESVPEFKPSAAGISMVMERLGFAADRTVMVGDSMYDAVSAEQAGVRFLGVTGSRHSQEVRDLGKRVADSLDEAAGLLST
jgi:phosphoglycolate phosphatase